MRSGISEYLFSYQSKHMVISDMYLLAIRSGSPSSDKCSNNRSLLTEPINLFHSIAVFFLLVSKSIKRNTASQSSALRTRSPFTLTLSSTTANSFLLKIL